MALWNENCYLAIKAYTYFDYKKDKYEKQTKFTQDKWPGFDKKLYHR